MSENEESIVVKDTQNQNRKETYDLIKSLHESGLGYRRIAHYLNSKNITTFTVKKWKGNYIKQMGWNFFITFCHGYYLFRLFYSFKI